MVPLIEGRNWICDLVFNGGKTYNLYVFVASEPLMIWSPQIVEGDWQVATPNKIAGFMYDNSTPNKNKVMEAYIWEGVAYMNNELKNYFATVTPQPQPASTWEEQFEGLLKALVLYIGSGGIPQVKPQG